VKGGLHACSHACPYTHGYCPRRWRYRRCPVVHAHLRSRPRSCTVGPSARLLPLSVDGLIIAASLALASAPVLARCVLALGVAATVAANVAYGLPHGALAAIVSARPGISFVGAAELLLRSRRHAPAEIPAAVLVPALRDAPEVPGTPDVPVPDIPLPPDVPADVPAESDAARVFAAELAAGKVPGIKTIRKRMRCGQPAAYRYQAELSELAAA
jgi:hypothetical protein